MIRTLWDCKQVNVGLEWKSNVDDKTPMSKVEDWWKIELEEGVNEIRKIDYGWRCRWIELRIDRKEWIWQGIGLEWWWCGGLN